MDNDKLKEHVNNITIDLPIPNALPSLVKYDLIFNKSRHFENKFSIEKSIITPQYQYQEQNLLEVVYKAYQNKPIKKTQIVKTQENDEKYTDVPDISYVDIVRESFAYIEDEIELADIDCVYDIYPDNDENDICTTNIKDTSFEMKVLEMYNLRKAPKLVSINDVEYNCMPVDMSEYVFVKFNGDKAHYKEIGSNLNLKPKK
ncbi:hypothetical protein BDAP_001119 [Binucleata daphniae]